MQPNSDWLEAQAPFKIAGNLYYVGSKGLASYLITTTQGHILINSNLEASVPMLRTSIESLGFNWADLKILLISHAHWDHDAGSAAIKQQTGAKYMVMDADVPVVESGGASDFHYGTDTLLRYPPAKVDRILHDGDSVRLGDARLIAHRTAGHTKGCTTWTLPVKDTGKVLNAVIICSPNVNGGYVLVKNANYPAIASDFENMFRVLKALPCDLFLGAHGSYFNMSAKVARMGQGPNPFIDPQGCASFISEREQAFRAALAKQAP